MIPGSDSALHLWTTLLTSLLDCTKTILLYLLRIEPPNLPGTTTDQRNGPFQKVFSVMIAHL